ncbi:hypothetical protein [Liquorilactobacillus oeni]|uniref:Integral membrane protein n=1 Tax=Liquorilactobacillus oeni DSM 19972 TaxID=1423777 RepID=A0A0R1MBN1_9LACO|nr:hypothetical protein [Liquorilactobacillus oeni]KRL05639.1 hypothetical protein FD46_GL000384 [Liquorilactobacillus oeni DSM 19972]
MANNNRFRSLNWGLIWILAVVALIRPLMSILGIMDTLGKSLTPIITTIGISIIWILAVYLKADLRPIFTLICTGIVYGILAILLSGILSTLLTGRLQGPLAHPVGIVGILVTNAIWGLITGFIASLLLKIKKSKK